MHQILCFLAVLIFSIHIGSCAIIDEIPTFYYFAYGSNMLSGRILLKNPTAVYINSAKLEKHRLDFNRFSQAWNGAVATVVDDSEVDIWGTLWTIHLDQMDNLDIQEGVHTGWYFAKNVTVTTPEGREVLARTYELVDTPLKVGYGEDLPRERRPSSTYLSVMALGAIESLLPADYIATLFTFPTNGLVASAERRQELGYPF